MHVFQNDDHLLELSNNKYRHFMWHHIKIQLKKKPYKSFKLVVKVRRGSVRSRSSGAVVIDDIVIENRNCDCKYSLKIKHQ